MTEPKAFLLNESDEVRYFAPKTWFFWRGIIVCFCLSCLIGHWLEIPYCLFMDMSFGVVDDNYNVWTDPLWVPYWVYGVGSAVITLTLFPLKIHITEHRRSMIAAVIQFFVIAVAVCALLELLLGLMINQPDPLTGEYPYWDNSSMPFNIFGQAWLVNDVILGLVSTFYVFLFFPFIQKAFSLIKPRSAHWLFVFVLAFFGFVCVLAYVVPLIPDLYSFLITPLFG